MFILSTFRHQNCVSSLLQPFKMIRKIREWTQNKVFYTIWILFHLAYQIQLELRDYFSFNFKYLKSRLWSCFPLYSQEGEIANFVKSVSKLHRVPKHLAISVIPDNTESILSTLIQHLGLLKSSKVSRKKEDDYTRDVEPKGINLQTFARVVAWASAADIPVISLYDYHGILKTRFKELGCYIQEELQQDFWAVKQMRDVTEPPILKFHNVHKSNGYVNGVNGSKSNQVLHIFVYSRRDGKPALLKAAKEICKDKLKSSNNVDEVSTNYSVPVKNNVDERTLDSYLNHCNGWPNSLTDAKTDPELMIILGNVKSTLGFLPWHIRLTEIHWLPSLQRLKLLDFYKSLQTYSSCQQRFGT